LRFYSHAMQQCADLNELVDRNRLDIMSVMTQYGEAVFAVAAVDEDAVDKTINRQGERYMEDVVWDSAAVRAAQVLLGEARGRLKSTAELRTKHMLTQSCSLQAMVAKWNVEKTKDVYLTWTEGADLERAQYLQQHMVNWVHTKFTRMAAFEKRLHRNNAELRIELNGYREQNDINLRSHAFESSQIQSCALNAIEILQARLEEQRLKFVDAKQLADESILQLSRECQELREKSVTVVAGYEEKTKLLQIMLRTVEYSMLQLSSQLQAVVDDKKATDMSSRKEIDELRVELRRERKHSAHLYFIIHSLRSSVGDLRREIQHLRDLHTVALDVYKVQNRQLRRDLYTQIFCLAHLSTDVKALFEFFSSRVANIAGSRKFINDELVKHHAADVMAALCRNPSIVIRRYATKALAGLGWNSNVETRLVMWDCIAYWEAFVTSLRVDGNVRFEDGFSKYLELGKLDVLVPIDCDRISDSEMPRDDSLRKQLTIRRQWALRNARRKEGPHQTSNQIGFDSSVIAILMDCISINAHTDWEIARNVALVLSISSYDDTKRQQMLRIPFCLKLLVSLCSPKHDVEVNCYSAVTISNICFNDEAIQAAFGDVGAIEALLSLCTSVAVDLLESAAGALVNLTSLSDTNCDRVLATQGVATIFNIINKPYSENLLDLDQNDEVQANAVEILTNISRYNCEQLSSSFDGDTITSLALLCASPNMQVKRQVALIYGNIAQNEFCRLEICNRGGVEALVLILEEKDSSLQANVLWALSNLMWLAPNQARAGRYMEVLFDFVKSPIGHVKSNALLLLANMLYYSDTNCDRILSMEGAFELIIELTRSHSDDLNLESCLRSLLSLSCIDAASLVLGSQSCVPLFLEYCGPSAVSITTARLALDILCNLCIHEANRKSIIESRGLEVMVDLFTHADAIVSARANQVVDRLKDIAPPEAIARIKADIGLANVVQLVGSIDPLIRLAAVESIGESVWKNSKTQGLLGNRGGLEALLRVCSEHVEDTMTLIPSLWSIKNIINDNFSLQSSFGENDGISIVINVLRLALLETYGAYTTQVIEASLTCLCTAILENKKNSRFLVQHSKGISLLIQISDTGNTKRKQGSRPVKINDANATLANSMLNMLGKYNYIVCRHCSKKQDVNGSSCLHCGYKLVFEVVDTSKPMK
jgi:hypothetical protein